jgi:hypothetical protein
VVAVSLPIHGIGVDLAGAVAVDRCPDMAEQFGQPRLVVGADPFKCGAPFSFRAHDGTVPCSSQAGRGPGSPALTQAARINRLLHTGGDARLLTARLVTQREPKRRGRRKIRAGISASALAGSADDRGVVVLALTGGVS